MLQLRRATTAARRLAWYVRGRRVRAAASRYGPAYSYVLAADAGQDFAADFTPAFSPGDMLRLGIFEGRYLNDCTGEFPREWFEDALAADCLRPEGADKTVNLFGISSRQSLGHWRRQGWVPALPGDPDGRGWFQWYCRYWLGRRLDALDRHQIGRWKSFRRHAGQIRAAAARLGDAAPQGRAAKKLHRPKQRQALLQWAHDPWI